MSVNVRGCSFCCIIKSMLNSVQQCDVDFLSSIFSYVTGINVSFLKTRSLKVWIYNCPLNVEISSWDFLWKAIKFGFYQLLKVTESRNWLRSVKHWTIVSWHITAIKQHNLQTGGATEVWLFGRIQSQWNDPLLLYWKSTGDAPRSRLPCDKLQHRIWKHSQTRSGCNYCFSRRACSRVEVAHSVNSAIITSCWHRGCWHQLTTSVWLLWPERETTSWQ